jgi:hypothetical protein
MKEYTLELCRVFDDEKQTLGQFDVVDESTSLLSMPPQPCIRFTCFCLELPWKNNEFQVSCIPAGEYRVVKHVSKKFGECFWIKDIPNRSAVLIHGGTNFKHTLGCILPAMDQSDLDKDGHLDNTSSKKALAELLKYNITKIKIYYRP